MSSGAAVVVSFSKPLWQPHWNMSETARFLWDRSLFLLAVGLDRSGCSFPGAGSPGVISVHLTAPAGRKMRLGGGMPKTAPKPAVGNSNLPPSLLRV